MFFTKFLTKVWFSKIFFLSNRQKQLFSVFHNKQLIKRNASPTFFLAMCVKQFSFPSTLSAEGWSTHINYIYIYIIIPSPQFLWHVHCEALWLHRNYIIRKGYFPWNGGVYTPMDITSQCLRRWNQYQPNGNVNIRLFWLN